MSTTKATGASEAELEQLRTLTHAPGRNLVRVLVFLLLLFIGPLVGGTYWMNRRAARELEQVELQRVVVRARTVAALVEQEFISAQKILTSIAGRHMFRDAWARRDLPALNRHFQEVRELEPAFLFVSVYGRDGTMRAILPADPIVGQNFSYRDWYRGVTADWQPYFSEVYRTAAAPNPLVVAVAVPIPDEAGKPQGILMATYALDQLVKKFEILEAGSLGASYVVDQRGVVAVSHEIDPYGEPVMAPEPGAVARALAGEEGHGRFGSGAGEKFVGYAPVPKLDWAVLYRRPANEALVAASGLRRQNLWISFGLLLVYLATTALAGLLVRRQGQLLAANRALNRALDERLVERTRAEEALRRSESRFRTLVELAPEAMVIADRAGRILLVNQQVEKAFGYTREELVGQSIEVLLPERFSGVHASHRRRYFLSPIPRRMGAGLELVGRRKDGSEFPVDISLSPIETDEGVVVTATISDITERKRAEQMLVHAKEEAERASKFKDQFLSTMSHELRTPLNAVMGFSDLLRDERHGTLNERQRRYVTHIREGGEHLLKLINDILDLSKIEAGRLELAFEQVPVQRAFGEVLSALRPLSEKKSQTLSQVVEPGLVVRADAMRLRQVLMNLVGNAIKFTPEGGSIEVAATRVDGQVRVEVCDTGPGIPPEEQKRIFEAFYQLRQSGKATEGTGLGLAISQRLVELQGGQLGLESQPGCGSRFFFTLPAGRTVREPRPRETAPRAKAIEAPQILVIEDDAVAAQLIETQLGSAGYQAVLCLGPQRALELAAELQPQAITLDLLMKPTNGWEILVELKNNPRTSAIPVIVVTLVDQPAMGISLGADEYLVKPVEKEALLAAIERCIGTKGDPAVTRPILVAEDDAPTREMIADLLRAEGYSVVPVDDGAQARAQVATALPALVMLDLALPKVSGFELLAEWRASPRTVDLPVFVLTAKDLSAEEEKYIRGHAESLFRKHQPWQEALLKELRRLMMHAQPEKA